MNFSMDDFDKIDKCQNCGKKIIVIKLNYVKKKLATVTEKELKSFKICSTCKRNLN